MNYDDFTITSNGDGTYTLSPKGTDPEQDAIVAEYRRIKNLGLQLLAHRNDVNTRLAELVARRDELKTLLLGDGVDPDSE